LVSDFFGEIFARPISKSNPMKKLITVAILLFTIQAKCQNFEGTIKWSMKMEVTDPKKKAQMEEAQKKMNDPATQAQMKELEAKMKDPEFKKMMDANPQMKAQMEASMKMMQGGGGMEGMMPKGMVVKIKNGNTDTKMEGGMMDGYETLFLKDKNQMVRLDRANKMYTITSSGDAGQQGGDGPKPKITKTSETARVMGYNCTKYTAESTGRDGKSVTQVFWTTTEIKDWDMNHLTKQRSGPGGNRIFYEGIEGVPLKIESGTPEGMLVMEVTEIKRETLSASDFTIPADFKEGKAPGKY
jgi:hypothetical protein